MQTSLDFSLSTDLGRWEHKTGERTPTLRKQGFLSLLYTARWGLFFTFRDSESAGSGKPNMKSGSEKSPDRFFFGGGGFARRSGRRTAAEERSGGGNAAIRGIRNAGLRDTQKAAEIRGFRPCDVNRVVFRAAKNREARRARRRFIRARRAIPSADAHPSARRGYAARGYFTFGVRPRA